MVRGIMGRMRMRMEIRGEKRGVCIKKVSLMVYCGLGLWLVGVVFCCSGVS